jgi:hypothetical protein
LWAWIPNALAVADNKARARIMDDACLIVEYYIRRVKN